MYLMVVALCIFCIVAAGISAGFLYQLVGAHRDRLRYAGDGRLVKIGHGHSLYVL